MIEERPRGVVLAELHNGEGFLACTWAPSSQQASWARKASTMRPRRAMDSTGIQPSKHLAFPQSRESVQSLPPEAHLQSDCILLLSWDNSDNRRHGHSVIAEKFCPYLRIQA